MWDLLFAQRLLEAALRDYSVNSGYLESTAGERTTKYSGLHRSCFISLSQSRLANLRSTIGFSIDAIEQRISQEHYEEKFGRTEEERVDLSPNRFTYYNDVYGFKGSSAQDD